MYPDRWFSDANGHSTGEAAIIPDEEIARLALDRGCDEQQAIIATALALAESSGIPNIANHVPAVGLWQINLQAHPNVTFACAIDPVCNSEQMWEISNHGEDWCPWATYEESCGRGYDGAYRDFLERARIGVSKASGLPKGPGPGGPKPIVPPSGPKPVKTEDLYAALEHLYNTLHIPFPLKENVMESEKRTYKVRLGDTLYNIARDQLGNAEEYHRLYEMNKDVIGPDVNTLQEGMELELPY